MDADAAREFVFTIEDMVKDVRLNPGGCKSHEDGLVIIDSAASVNFSSKWFGENPLLRNQTDQSASEARVEEHSKITESDKSG